jgi:predicted outer membrane lipoprotein|uniref:Cyd operon protein YbgT n=1 Tax=Acidicaldus sp. TaxID=1872105 RepID=A0A8J4HET9_9PROT
MKTLIKFLGLAGVLFLALLLAVVAGDYGPWYFAWLVGTTMIVLIAAAGAVLMETQTSAGRRDEEF